ncbi:DUF4962 domain-containing protein [Verrucomicrobiota bacterium]
MAATKGTTMISTGHPHPHIDPRQPRQGSRAGTNPPVFVWKPGDSDATFDLAVARDPDFRDPVLDLRGLTEPMFLPEAALPAGQYFWQWRSGGDRSEVFQFEIAPDAVTMEIPRAGEWLKRLPSAHPRIYVRPEDVQALRRSRGGVRPEIREQLARSADALLAESHDIDEPPFLPDRDADYDSWFGVWYRVMWESRRFVQGAEALGLAYLASGDERYARAACRRMASVSKWDPEGSSHLQHNDEAHMSVIWCGPGACDWVWDQFTEQELEAVICQFRARGRITFDFMHDHGSYGVTRFDSHAGREIVFLAMIALVFHEHIPEAETWLEWLRPVLCGIWPIWAAGDGGWAEGVSYSLAYVQIMTRFATALKAGTGLDLYRRPFWKGHVRWRRCCLPPYAEWIGFGDHTERWRATWERNADLVDIIARQVGMPGAAPYVAALRREAESMQTPAERRAPALDPQICLLPPVSGAAKPPQQTMLSVFPGAGWATLRTAPEEPEKDVALIFRSSPYGSISHSHANNNDFILHVGGRIMAMPSGYYDGYGSAHHMNWVWHTKSHNCLTLSDAPQLMRSHESRGTVECAFEDERLTYFRGNADASYTDRADRCRRHIVYLKKHTCFLMVDEFKARPGVHSAPQWNVHSWNRFSVNEKERSFRIVRGKSRLTARFLYHQNAYFSLSEGWDPPPGSRKPSEQWKNQYHLRFTPCVDLPASLNLGVLLCAGLPGSRCARAVTERLGSAEVARIGEDVVAVNQGGGMNVAGAPTEALIRIELSGAVYEVSDDGIDLLKPLP